MQVSSSQAVMSRAVTPAKGSSDRRSNDEAQQAITETKSQERAHRQRQIQADLQQRNEEEQRRLDGRLISFGQEEDSVSNEQKQASFNRSRVNDAYSPPKDEPSNSQSQQIRSSHDMNTEAIDIVV